MSVPVSTYQLEEFSAVQTRSSNFSIVHGPTGVRLHSFIDPAAEAIELAQQYVASNSKSIVIVGGSLGYLPEAICSQRGSCDHVTTVEMDLELLALARHIRPESDYVRGKAGTVRFAPTATEFSNAVHDLTNDTALVISPYVFKLPTLSSIASYLAVLRSEFASASRYREPLAAHTARNVVALEKLRPWTDIRLPEHSVIVVVGAGPGLNRCAESLRVYRSNLCIVAASGAVPALRTEQLSPDVVMIMESDESAASDTAFIEPVSQLIVFPFANLDALESRLNQVFNAAPQAAAKLFSRGGSSVIPALDFALAASAAPLLLVGVDLSASEGLYASGSLRETSGFGEGRLHQSRFESMRWGLERVLENQQTPSRTVAHVISHHRPLHGSTKASFERVPLLLKQLTHIGATHAVV